MTRPSASSSLTFHAIQIHAIALTILLGAASVAAPQTLPRRPARRAAAKPAASVAQSSQPKFKGVFEPVNYNQDLTLFDAFFVTSEEGWVSGASGTILHTSDGGKTWTVQLGGDPQSQGEDIIRLFFLDSTHGWAQCRHSQLFRTTDGQNWQQVNSDVRGQNVVFITASHGFYAYGGKVYSTEDGGATWKDSYTCASQAVIQGLTKQFTCDVNSLQFVTPLVGYGVGTNNAVLGGGAIVKTDDGGSSWNVIFIPQESGDQRINVVSFLDELRGFVLRNTGMYRTLDAGKTWQGVPATLPQNSAPLKFADPQVGWSAAQLPANFSTARLAFTSDGGVHWLARDLNFPAVMHGFALPRRDRAYIVGEHGMIYRYSVVLAAYQAPPHSIIGPLMPEIDSSVPTELATLNDVLGKLRSKLPASPASAAAAPPAPASAGFQQDTGAGGGGYVDSCCGPLVQQLEATANTFAVDVPAFAQRFRSLNLILQGFQFMNQVTTQAQTLKQQIRALRQARDPQAAAVALGQVSTQVNGITASGGFVQDTTLPPQK
ncbi:MAG TPA: YCF48-related protein [Candidatus Methylomirabilis sp.]|nr:YCF48-related protein [Candidatus Methylomirabilis sp.]